MTFNMHNGIEFYSGFEQRCTFPNKILRGSTTIAILLYCTGYVDIITELIHILSGRMIKSFDFMRPKPPQDAKVFADCGQS